MADKEIYETDDWDLHLAARSENAAVLISLYDQASVLYPEAWAAYVECNRDLNDADTAAVNAGTYDNDDALNARLGCTRKLAQRLEQVASEADEREQVVDITPP